MDKAKRARKAETLKQPSLGLRLRAPHLIPTNVTSRRLAKSIVSCRGHAGCLRNFRTPRRLNAGGTRHQWRLAWCSAPHLPATHRKARSRPPARSMNPRSDFNAGPQVIVDAGLAQEVVRAIRQRGVKQGDAQEMTLAQ
jgi:hypothetical protein